MRRHVSFLEGCVMIVIGIIIWNMILVFFDASSKEDKKSSDPKEQPITINGCEYTLTHKPGCKNPNHTKQ